MQTSSLPRISCASLGAQPQRLHGFKYLCCMVAFRNCAADSPQNVVFEQIRHRGTALINEAWVEWILCVDLSCKATPPCLFTCSTSIMSGCLVHCPWIWERWTNPATSAKPKRGNRFSAKSLCRRNHQGCRLRGALNIRRAFTISAQITEAKTAKSI